jgi:hypothetical protein
MAPLSDCQEVCEEVNPMHVSYIAFLQSRKDTRGNEEAAATKEGNAQNTDALDVFLGFEAATA